MDEQELIQVNLRLPASALDSLSNLAEQLRKLTAVVNGLSQSSSTSEETVESGFFDPERFLALRREAEESAVRTSKNDAPEAKSVNTKVLEQVREPESAGRTEAPAEPVGEESLLREETDHLEPAGQAAEETMTEDSEEIPSARLEMEEQVPDAPSVRMEPESQIPEAEEVWAQPEERDFPLPAAQSEPLTGIETPLGAGIVVTAQPEVPASRWTGVTEELVTAGPAPLTDEAVSLAFQRDGRRYDNGFPLY